MKQRIGIALGILFLGLAYAGYQLYLFKSEDVPKLDAERAKANAELSSKEAELKRIQNFKKNIENVKLELKELNVQLTTALEYMPRTFELSKLLLKLTLLAQNSGVDLVSFKPKKGEDKKEGAFYSTIGIDIEMRGTFTQTLVFLDQLSRLKRIVNIDSLRIRPQDAAAQKTSIIAANTHASIKTYRFAE